MEITRYDKKMGRGVGFPQNSKGLINNKHIL